MKEQSPWNLDRRVFLKAAGTGLAGALVGTGLAGVVSTPGDVGAAEVAPP